LCSASAVRVLRTEGADDGAAGDTDMLGVGEAAAREACGALRVRTG
jgi:hypothetical protein